MISFLIGLGTVILLLCSVYLVLIILMQRASANSGMGAALGGGAAESALGGGAGNVLTKGTIWGMAVFFVLALALFLGHLGQNIDTVVARETLDLRSLSERALQEQEAEEAAAFEQGSLTGDTEDLFGDEAVEVPLLLDNPEAVTPDSESATATEPEATLEADTEPAATEPVSE